jgi:hypothetical protein
MPVTFKRGEATRKFSPGPPRDARKLQNLPAPPKSSQSPSSKAMQTSGGYLPANFQNKKSSFTDGIQSFFDKGRAENQITGNDFVSDLKKSSQFLYAQHPYAQELKKKYNLEDDDIINLRIGVTQPGHSNKISQVYANKVIPTMQNNLAPGFRGDVMNAFEKGMKMSDPFNPYPEDTFMGRLTKSFQSSPFSLLTNAFGGSDRGQPGYYFAQNEYKDSMPSDDYKTFAASIANNPELYEAMMATPLMKQYAVDQYAYDVQRTNPMKKDNGIMDIPVVEPAPYDFVRDNPFFN